ncbi:cutinase family protein, partial [Mycobacterium ostraviense]|uniref:cutinase family protein n=1 Tax=Mycobacterium ostraviense TaxID=2738409 RepID=UPI0012900317
MDTYRAVIASPVVRILGPAVVTVWGISASVLPGFVVPAASAEPCPDVEVVFARGTGEAPGVGPTGQAFVDSLRSRAGGKTFGVYPVNYPASDQWDTGIDGIRAVSNRHLGAHATQRSLVCRQEGEKTRGAGG